MLIQIPKATLYYNEDILKHMEHCGRNCYASFDKETEDSAERFLNNRMQDNPPHWAVFEHAGIVLKEDTHPTKEPNQVEFGQLAARDGAGGIRVSDALMYGFCKDLKDLKNFERDPQLITFEIVCSRATSAQLCRHRTVSICERSLRFCKYDNLDTFSCCPPMISEDYDLKPFISCWKHEWEAYKKLLDSGLTPDAARYVLPLATTTYLYITASKYWWKRLICKRYDPAASTSAIKLCMDIVSQAPELGEMCNPITMEKAAAKVPSIKVEGL